MDALYASGKLSCSHRNRQFERAYDLPERVLPERIRKTPTPTAHQSHVILIRRAAAALGVASEGCLADYFRTEKAATRAAIDELVTSGELEPVTVTGWRRSCWLWADAKQPKRVRGAALVNPFDSLIFERKRTKALFDLDYRIEIYIPDAKRRHGYYVFPFLLDEEFVARVDLKADRREKKLLVKAAWAESNRGAPRHRVTAELAIALRDMASWLGLGDIQALDKGDLAAELTRELTHRG